MLFMTAGILHAPGASGQERKLAVVIGVNAYRGNSGLPRLQHAEADAKALSSTLRDVDFKVFEMTHEAARSEGQEEMSPQLVYIRDQILNVLNYPNLGAKDSVLITLHGHGVQFDHLDNDGKKTPKFFFCPADATVAGLKSANDITERNRLLPLEELYADLEKCTAATKLLIVDACRNDPASPAVFREALASSTLPKLPPPPGGTVAFFSCKANQRSVEDKALQQGVFSHFLVKGLRGEADLSFGGKKADGVITFSELSTYVANKTYEHVLNKFRVRQSPELRGDYDLNLPLVRLRHSLPNAAGIKFVEIPAGSFLMGSPDDEELRDDDEGPQFRVAISEPFYAGMYEVTIGQVLQWLNSPDVTVDDAWIDFESEHSPVRRSGNRWVRNASSKFAASDDQPMQNISWHGAVAFCEWLSQRDERFTYRLPTESEWEYLARAGSTTAFHWGRTANGQRANCDGSSPYGTTTKGPNRGVTTTVGSYPANAFGLHDTAGNVCEWCSLGYNDYSDLAAAELLLAPLAVTSREVVRGGSWKNGPNLARSAQRIPMSPEFCHFSMVGFRVVCDMN